MLYHGKKYLAAAVGMLLTVISIVAFQGGSALPAYAATTVTIFPSQHYQTIEGWGTSLAWWANIIGGWSPDQRIALANALYDPSKGLGLNVVRYNFGADGPGNVCHDQMRPGGNVPSFEPMPGVYVWSNDANQLWFAQAAKARGADRFEGFVDSPPAWMLKNQCTAGGLNGAENLDPAHYNDFASYLTTIARHFHDEFHIPLQTVEPFNEPGGTWWKSTGNQEGMYVTQNTQHMIISLLASALAHNAPYTRVAAPDDYAMTWSIADYQSYTSSTRADIAQWNTHAYSASNSARDTAYRLIGQTDHKRLWMSEWGTGSQGSPIAAGLALSREILDDEQHLHPTAWVAWQAVNTGGGAPDDLWGLAYLDSATATLSYPSRYYAMGNYSKFVREGSQMIGNSDANTFTAYDPHRHTLAIITTNSTSGNTMVDYDLSQFKHVGATAIPYRTSADENLQRLSPVSLSNKHLTSLLPARSITTFVIPALT